MRNVKFGLFFLGLTVAMAGAVAVAAQDRVEPRRDIRVFGEGGSQLGIRVSDAANGVRVDDVDSGSPADKAGIREGDIVVEFDGERVRSAMQFTRLVRETPNGRSVAVAVMRDGKRQALQATPENREPAAGNWDPEVFLRELPHFDFEFDDRFPRRFEFRLPGPGSRFPELRRGRLGVSVQSLTPELEEYFGAKNGGVLVSSVAQDSAAAKAGIKAGDVITSINSRQVTDTADLTRELRDLAGEVTIVVLRDKKEMTLKGTLAPRQ
jgi:S1-C subfamily serine protease